MNDIYKKQVALLIRIMPSVYRIKDFAVHGGTAINLFHKNMPRYSVDIDLTYIPVKERAESLDAINNHLRTLKSYIEKSIPGIKVIHKHDVWKLQCTLDGATNNVCAHARAFPPVRLKTALSRIYPKNLAAKRVFSLDGVLRYSCFSSPVSLVYYIYYYANCQLVVINCAPRTRTIIFAMQVIFWLHQS